MVGWGWKIVVFSQLVNESMFASWIEADWHEAKGFIVDRISSNYLYCTIYHSPAMAMVKAGLARLEDAKDDLSDCKSVAQDLYTILKREGLEKVVATIESGGQFSPVQLSKGEQYADFFTKNEKMTPKDVSVKWFIACFLAGYYWSQDDANKPPSSPISLLQEALADPDISNWLTTIKLAPAAQTGK